MPGPLYKPPLQNSLQYTLDTAFTAGGTVLSLNSTITSTVQAPGVCVVDRIDSSGNKTPTKREYFTFTGVSGQTLTGVVGGLAGSTAQNHSVGAVVEFIYDIIQNQAQYDVITQEHSIMGQHTSLPSVTQMRTLNLSVLSTASIVQDFTLGLNVASNASIYTAYIQQYLNLSGASIDGIFVSGASGSVLTSLGANKLPVFAPSSGGGTGGFNALFQVPGALASQTNVGGLIPVPTSFTAQFMEAFVQTPASVASISIVVKKNLNTVFGVISILAGATYASSASIANAALVATDNLTMDINSTASIASDLSLLLRAT